jgi:Flp pilus assembly protein protease CpaA
MLKYIFILLNAAVLIYGGVIDFRRREIPNVVPVVLMVGGSILHFSLFKSIIGLTVTAVLLLAGAKFTKSEIPGGDFKLLCSLGYACGLQEIVIITFLAGIGAMFYGFLKHLPIKRRIPLCSYIAPAYITFQAIAFVIGRG